MYRCSAPNLCLADQPTSAPAACLQSSSIRESARPEETKESKEQEQQQQLLSPTASNSIEHKRKRSLSHNSREKHDPDYKKLKSAPRTPDSLKVILDDPVAHWASTNYWPPNFSEEGRKMSSEPSKKRKNQSESSTTRRSESDSASKQTREALHRFGIISQMQQHGIIMAASNLMKEESRELCNKLLEGTRSPVSYPCFPVEKLFDVLARLEDANEPRIQRDILPWVVPSVENLHFSGEPGLAFIREELSTDWTGCATMGATRPKPDYVAGLPEKAFSRDELDILKKYATPTRPFRFTNELCFPFLICEAKSGEVGLNRANRQNLHSAGIAVRALIELHWAAYEQDDPHVPYGQVLVFTISHNHNTVDIYGHFGMLAGDGAGKLEIYRRQIALYSLSLNEGRDRNKSYNFVYNVYQQFVPQHLARIKEAAKQMFEKEKRAGASTGESNMTRANTQLMQNAEDPPRQSSDAFLRPGTPPSFVIERREMKEQMEAMRKLVDEQSKLIADLRASGNL
ncbi:MAG: hypothetical protein LQ340_000527 [Diploschistes diacapsis]|nr:MAG: hypothetical protein LQ340_000527 [Diploschistes diacapsis]